VSEQLPPIPSFLINGAQKGATRWLRLNLGRHPKIYTPEAELSFFNTGKYRHGLDGYRRLFEGWEGEPMVGEATPGYMIWRHDPDQVAERIEREIPDVQLFAILRDPVDRLYSAVVHHGRRGRVDPDDDIVELVRRTPPEEDPMQLVAGGWYARCLRPYMSRFGDGLQVILNEDARRDPVGVYSGALQALGLDDDYVPPELSEVVFSRTPPKGSRYFEKGKGRRPLSPAEKRLLYEYFADDIDELEQTLDRDLSAWRHE
jgi:hypothetical protein